MGDVEVDIRKYVEEPTSLLALCQAVVNELLSSINDSELRVKQAQLTEVSRSIDQLTKLSIAIPDELRNLKINLLTETEIPIQSREKLGKILFGLNEINKIIDAALISDHPKKKRVRKRSPKSNIPHTKKEVFRSEIIDALRMLGGSGTNQEVIKIVEQRMRDNLLPGDFEKTARGTTVWIYNLNWERNSMREEGILQSDSPRGTWELSEGHK